MVERTDAERTYLFWAVCIPVRLAIAVSLTILLLYTDTQSLNIAVAVYLWITAFFFAVNIVRAKLGWKTEGGLGGIVWWNYLRYVHVLTYATTGALVFLDIDYGPLVLLLDIGVGIIGKLRHDIWSRIL